MIVVVVVVVVVVVAVIIIIIKVVVVVVVVTVMVYYNPPPPNTNDNHDRKRRPQTTPTGRILTSTGRILPPLESQWASSQLSQVATADVVGDGSSGSSSSKGVKRIKIRRYDEVIDDGDTTMFERESPRSMKILRSLLLTFMDDGDNCTLKKRIDLRR